MALKKGEGQDKYPKADVLFTDNNINPVSEEQNKQYSVIIRKRIDYSYTKYYPHILVSLYPSDEVNQLTDSVLNAMGTSLAEVKKRLLIYQEVDFSTNRDIFQQGMPNDPLYYAGLHIRIGHGTRKTNTKCWAQPQRLKRTISRAVPCVFQITIFIIHL